MNISAEGTVITGAGIDLTEEEILRLEIRMIEKGRMSETQKLEYNDNSELVVVNIENEQLMESGASSSNTAPLFSRTQNVRVGQPSREAYTGFLGKRDNFKPMGKRLERTYKRRLIYDNIMLTLRAYDIEEWPEMLEVWSKMVVKKFEKLRRVRTPQEMYSYLEIFFLGSTEREMWESYKQNCPQEFNRDLELGSNPYNFTNKMKLLILGDQLKSGFNKQQEALRKLEQLQIKNWKFIKPFLQDFMDYSLMAGCFYDKTICDSLFMKLPDPLGTIIHNKFEEQIRLDDKPHLDNVETRIRFIIDYIEKIMKQQE